ncbi:MAG: SMI1/KNR4 family protein [Cyanobacteria bacterium REEB67]|nr:SMI1/KNR4 family protein [Cyanobacteria bacterium REEB67]
MRVVDAATRLFDLMSDADVEFPRHLTSGLGDEDLQALQAFHRVKLPAEVLAFYGAFSLPVYYQQLDCKSNFFDGFGMFSLQLGLLRKYTLNKSIGDFYPLYERRDGWLPFLEDKANYFLLDTAFGNLQDGSCPLLFLPHGGNPELRFRSLTAFFDTMHDWLAEGILHVEDGLLSKSCHARPEQLAEVALLHNSGLTYWQDIVACAGIVQTDLSGLVLANDVDCEPVDNNVSGKIAE